MGPLARRSRLAEMCGEAAQKFGELREGDGEPIDLRQLFKAHLAESLRADSRAALIPRIFLAPGRRLSLEPGARTGRTGRTKAPERILLLTRGARLSRGCPHFLFLCFFLRLLNNAALCDHGRWLVQGPSRKRFRWAGRYPRRICIIFHDRLGWRLISGEPGIRSNGGLHQPKKKEEKGRVGSNGDPGGSGQAAILVSRGARPKRIATKIHPRPPS
jgi:hypothetical protein